MTDQHDPTETTVTPEPQVPTPPSAPIAPIARQPGAGADPVATAPVMWSAHEAVSAPVIAPVVPVTATRRPSGRFRWAIALVVVALVAGTASAAFLALSGSASARSTLAKWAPADTLLYTEARVDLPGSQHAALGTFLSAFPGFADQSTLDSKLNEIYDRLVRDATNGSQDYSTKIKPWFDGQVALASEWFPGMVPGTPSTTTRAALIASVTDGTKATAWLAGLPAIDGTTTASYSGVQLSIVARNGQQYAWGIDGSILVAGDEQSVHDVIDTKGSGGLAAKANFKEAEAAFTGDHLAFVYVDYKGLIDTTLKSVPATLGTAPAVLLAKLPAWVAVAIRADGNNLIADTGGPTPAGTPASKNRTSSIATHLPVSTIAEFEIHDLGAIVTDTVKSYSAIPEYKDQIAAMTTELDKVGGLDSFTSWLGDASTVVTKDGASYGGGVVIALPDDKSADTAKGKLATIKNLVNLAGAGKVTAPDAAYDGATITTLDFGDLSQFSPGTSFPAEIGDGRAAISFTMSNGLVVFGVGGDSFVKAVLDTKAGSSLADQGRYKTAIDAAGGANVAQGYMDLKTIVAAVVAAMPADQQPTFVSNVLPYLGQFQSFSFGNHAGDIQHTLFVLTAGK